MILTIGIGFAAASKILSLAEMGLARYKKRASGCTDRARI